MPDWRFVATDARTGTDLGDLPLSGVSFSDDLGGGPLSATLDLSQTTRTGAPLSRSLLDASTPRRTRLWVDRDGLLVWSGLIWSRARRRGSRGEVSIGAISTLDYFSHVRLTVTKTYTAADQFDVVRDLITWAQAQPGADLGVQYGAELSGVPVDRAPLAWGYELRPIYDLVHDLAGGDNGFDVTIEPAWIADQPVDTLRLYSPRRGRRVDQSELVFFAAGGHTGNLIDFDVDEDGSDSATTVYGIGAGEGDSMLLVEANRPDLIDAGFVRTDATISHKPISDPDTLLALTVADLATRADQPLTWTLEVDPDDTSTPYGSWIVGDDARLKIDDDPMFPAGTNGEPGLETVVRIIGQTIDIDDDGGPDTVTLRIGPAGG